MLISFLLSVVDDNKRNMVQYLYDKYDKEFIRYAKSHLKNVDGKNYIDFAYDVVCNTYVSLLLYLPDEIKFERAYVFQVLKIEIAKFLKKEKRMTVEQIDETDDFSSEEDFINDFLTKEKINKVKEIIKNLDSKYQIPIFLYYGCHVPINVIAAQLEITEEAVYSRLSRARSQIKKKYEEEEGKNG